MELPRRKRLILTHHLLLEADDCLLRNTGAAPYSNRWKDGPQLEGHRQ